MTWAHKARGSEGGEPDETGFPREGYALGDLAGAVSLSIPMEVYEAEARERTMANVSLFGALAAVIVAVAVAVNGALRRQGRQMDTLDAASLEADRYRVEILPLMCSTWRMRWRRPLRLTMALTAARDGLLIEVADTGIGIPEDELATIFERFRQADSSISRRYGGSGLGLALVKEMAELLGGRATVQSEVGVGSVFRASHPGAVMGKDELIEELWGEEYLDGAISIAVYVRKIREKIEENPAKPAYLKTVWGVGYSFEA